MSPRHADYLPEGERVDLADFLADCTFDDPNPRIWIMPEGPAHDDGLWSGSCATDEEVARFKGSRDDVIAWARRTPAMNRYLWDGQRPVELEPLPDDAGPPLPAGPTVEVRGPNHDGRWVAVWYHRGEVKQFWGDREKVLAWAGAQPAERRRLSVDGEPWQQLEA